MFGAGKSFYHKWNPVAGGARLREFFDALPLPGRTETPDDGLTAVISLIRQVLGGASGMTSGDAEFVRQHFSEYYTPEELARLMTLLREDRETDPDAAVKALSGMPAERKEDIVRLLLALDGELRGGAGRETIIVPAAEKLGVPREACEVMIAGIEAKEKQRQIILRSGAGIAVAVAVLAVFVLTATVLKSVIFGLILAYMMLPLERYFERRLERGFLRRCWDVLSLPALPLRRISGRLSRGRRGTLSDAEKEAARRRALTARAVGLTAATLLLFIVLAFALLISLSRSYVRNWNASSGNGVHSSKTVAAQSVAPQDAPDDPSGRAEAPRTSAPGGENVLERLRAWLESRRGDLEENPPVRFAVRWIQKTLNDPETQKELALTVFRRSGGMLSFAAGVIGTAVSLAVNGLLTVFFFLLFLSKLAAYCSENKSANRPSEYLVNTIFSGTWMPRAEEGTLAEARRIIGAVIEKLRIWLKGYLTLIGIDMLVYTAAYYFIGVPYFYILGPMTAFCVILPVIGPLSATVLTMLVTLAAGGAHASMVQLLAIFAVYLIQNTLIEQFILYPAIFGEALGLTLLETVIVVLLGGIFAGIAGMIFALPTAAVLKYLIPRIYHCLEMKNDRS